MKLNTVYKKKILPNDFGFSFLIQGEHLITTRTTTQGINSNDTSSFVGNALTCRSIQTNDIQNQFNRFHLLRGIVIMFPIALILTNTYLWLTYREKRRKINSRKMQIHVSNVNDNVHDIRGRL